MNSSTRPNTLFWIVSVIALIWNIMGVMAYLGQVYMDEATLQDMPPADQAYYANVPSWVTAAFAIAVFAGALGSIALLLRKKVSYTLFIISVLAVFAQSVYTFFMQTDIDLQGTRMLWPLLVIAISIFLVFFSKNGVKKGILI